MHSDPSPDPTPSPTPERDWAYELWVHLSDHVQQKWTAEEPDDCEHCKNAEVDCDDCRKLLVEWESALNEDGGYYQPPSGATHQKMYDALLTIWRNVHPSGRVSSCAGLPYCPGCLAASVIGDDS